MRNKLKYITNTIAIILFISICSCKTKAPQQNNNQPNSIETKEGYTKATIINYAVDGCSWMIQLEDGKKLEPSNLADEFKKENLKVWIQYQVKKGGMSICMAGEMVTITTIEIR